MLTATCLAARFGLRRNLLPLGCGLAGLVMNCLMVLVIGKSDTWHVDFNQFYSAGKLVGSGRLYNWESIRALELENTSTAVPFGRIPAFAAAFKPLSALPYPLALSLWLCVGVAALAGFVFLWPFSLRAWACVAICWSAPVGVCLLLGQDSTLFLFFAALGLRLLMREHDFWAGVVFSACLAKPHLALLLPVFLVARAKWTAILGGVAGVSVSLAVSFVAEGRQWPHRLITLALIPEFDPAAERMPNLRGLLSFLGGGIAAEVGFGLVVVAAIWFLSRRHPLPTVGALVLAGGLLLSHHTYVYDALLLLPSLLLPFQIPCLDSMRKWAIILLSPTPYLFLTAQALSSSWTTPVGLLVFLAHMAITGYTLTLLAVMLWRLPIHSESLEGGPPNCKRSYDHPHVSLLTVGPMPNPPR